MDTEICASARSGTLIMVKPSASVHADRTRIQWDVCRMVVASFAWTVRAIAADPAPICNGNTEAAPVSGRYRTWATPIGNNSVEAPRRLKLRAPPHRRH